MPGRANKSGNGSSSIENYSLPMTEAPVRSSELLHSRTGVPTFRKMKTRLTTFLACCILAAASTIAAAADAKPNVLWIIAEDA